MADRVKKGFFAKWWPFGGGRGNPNAMTQVEQIGGRSIRWPTTHEQCPGDWQHNREAPADFCLSYYAVYSAVTLISSDIGKLRPQISRRSARGLKIRELSNPVQKLLDKPNNYQNRIQFYECWSISKLIAGNTYALKDRDSSGKVVQLFVLDPFRVKPLISPRGEIFYQVSTDVLSGVMEDIIVPAREIIHDRGNCVFHPLVGLSPLFSACISAGIGQSIQDNADAFFRNGSTPGGILTAPGAIDDEVADKMKSRWNEKFSGNKRGSVAVLGNGLSFEQLRMTSVDAQMIEQLKWTAENIAAIFHVPGYKIGVGTQPTYNNVEVLNQVYYQDCLQTRVEAMELCLTEGLESDLGEGREVEFGLMTLLRMDTATRYKTWKEGISGGWLEPNWVRAQEQLEPVDGGDTPYLQQQNWSLAALADRDAAGPDAPPPAPPQPPQDASAALLGAQARALEEILRVLQEERKNASAPPPEEPSFAEVKHALEIELAVLETASA